MGRDEALAAIRPHEAELRGAGLAALYLFGSVARNEQGDASDIDLLFEVRDRRSFNLLSKAAIASRLQTLLGHHVDLVGRESVLPWVREQIEQNAVRIF